MVHLRWFDAPTLCHTCRDNYFGCCVCNEFRFSDPIPKNQLCTINETLPSMHNKWNYCSQPVSSACSKTGEDLHTTNETLPLMRASGLRMCCSQLVSNARLKAWNVISFVPWMTQCPWCMCIVWNIALHNPCCGECLVVNYECYLVYLTNSHMHVSKTKPLMCVRYCLDIVWYY